MLVKDYESCLRISREVDEEMELSDIERNDIVSTLIVKEYNKSGIGELSDPERFRLAGDLFSRYNMKMWEIASLLKISPKVVSQVLKSKDYGVK